MKYTLSDVTVVIKTFKRPKALCALIRSIRSYYPYIKILVADDSEAEEVERTRNLFEVKDNVDAYYAMEFDSGLSAGRNLLVSESETKLVFLLDDDFIFLESTRIEYALDILNCYENIDLVAGRALSGTFYGKQTFEDGQLIRDINLCSHIENRCPIFDFVPNFFVGKKENIERVKWDCELKIQEHMDFFYRAKGIIVTTYIPYFQINNTHSREDTDYDIFRKRVDYFQDLQSSKLGVEAIVSRTNPPNYSAKDIDSIFLAPISDYEKSLNAPIVSILIPIFNAEKTLDICLESASNQTLIDIEILCINDGSTDSSYEILQRHAAKDRRLRIIENLANLGESVTRNAGLDAATGSYVFHLDADDSIPVDALETLYKYSMGSNCEMIKGGYQKIYKDGSIENAAYATSTSPEISTCISESKLLQAIPGSHCSYLYKKSFLRHYKIDYPTNLSVGPDIVMLSKALLCAKNVTIIPNIVYSYHITDQSATRGEISGQIALDAIEAELLVYQSLKAAGFSKAGDERLSGIGYQVKVYWSNLAQGPNASSLPIVFEAFRTAFGSERGLWRHETPHHHRYTLALVAARRDDEAMEFLYTDTAITGFKDNAALIYALSLVAGLFPRDSGSLLELSKLAYENGQLNESFEHLSKIDTAKCNSIEPIRMKALILVQLGRHKEASEFLEHFLEGFSASYNTHEIESLIRLLITSHQLQLSEIDKLQNNARDEIQSCNKHVDELKKDFDNTLATITSEILRKNEQIHTIYSSGSWKITAPLRIIFGIFSK